MDVNKQSRASTASYTILNVLLSDLENTQTPTLSRGHNTCLQDIGNLLVPGEPPATAIGHAFTSDQTQQNDTESKPLKDSAKIASPSGHCPKSIGLSNPIHPLLCRSHFYQDGRGLYRAVEPILRLVTRLLTMDAVTKHLVVMVDGELRRDTEPWGAGVETNLAELAWLRDTKGQRPKVGRYPKPHQETVDDSMRKRAAQILDEANHLIRFDFRVMPSDPGLHNCSIWPA